MKTIDVTRSIFAYPAQILPPATLAERAVNLIALAKKRANDPSIFSDIDPFTWPALITNNRIDAYYTRMAADSLVNYESDANAGVSFQNSHNTDELSIGRSLQAQIKREAGGLTLPDEFGAAVDELIEVTADFYTMPGLRLASVNTDDFISGVRAGLVKDVSIGFYNAHYRCSICGLDLFDWDCPHIPGMPYNMTDTAGQVTGQRLAFAWVEKARLAEVSAVYKGATPGAAILKAQVEAEGGRMMQQERKTIETRYRCLLPARQLKITVPGSDERGNNMTSEEDNRTTDTSGQPPAPSPPAPAPTPSPAPSPAPAPTPAPVPTTPAEGTAERAASQNAGQAPGSDLLTTLRQILETARAAQPELLVDFTGFDNAEGLRTLVNLAVDGRTYRNDLIETAQAEGVRAYGATDWATKEPTYMPVLRGSTIAVIKQFITDWRSMGDKRLGGGRQIDEREGGDTSETPARNDAPSAAYM